MKSKLLFLMLCLVIFSCKKESLPNDCRLVEQFLFFNNDKIIYYYDGSNRVTGRTFFGNSVSLVPSATVMLYDSIAYNSSELVTVYRFECYFSPFSKDTLPYHVKDYYSKIETVLRNDRIVNSKNFYRKFNTNIDVLSSEKEFMYENNNISKIIEKGIINIPESYVRGNQTSIFVYENQKVKSVISEVLEEDGFKFGGDTLIINSYLTLKNPLRNFHMFYDISPLVYSENLVSEYNSNYFYKSRTGNFQSSGKSGNFMPRYTDNGKNYPQEFGTYICD